MLFWYFVVARDRLLALALLNEIENGALGFSQEYIGNDLYMKDIYLGE